MSVWNTAGPDQDVVLSSRVRLARNYADIPFPSAMSEKDAMSVIDKTLRILKEAPFMFRYWEMRSIGQRERVVMMERHLISPEMVENAQYGAALVSQDELVCVMINEEDHLRIQSMAPGFNLAAAADGARRIGDLLDASGAIARDERFGYLTACLTNAGTGLRASVMMHLPAMTMTRQIQPMIEAVNRHGLTVRGLYGEQSQAAGNLYQISNQVTMVRTAGEIMAAVEDAGRQIMARERNARAILMEKNAPRMQDRLFRSLGTLKYARRMNTREFMNLLSDLRLALSAGLVEGIGYERINEMMVTGQPAGLTAMTGRELESQERDAVRGDYVRSVMTGCVERT